MVTYTQEQITQTVICGVETPDERDSGGAGTDGRAQRVPEWLWARNPAKFLLHW